MSNRSAGARQLPRRRGRGPVGVFLVVTLLAGVLAQTGAGARPVMAIAAGGPNLGAPQRLCIPGKDPTCCPGADCVAHPDVVPASPLLIPTSVGIETISTHVIHVGQRFTITFHPGDRSSALWTFPEIAKRVSRCKTGLDLTCTYVARPGNVTYPEFATYDGWTDYSWGGINKFGAGIGSGYYAIIGNGIAVSGRLADKHGVGIARGGILNPGGPTPDPGVLIDFSVKRHGVLTPLFAAAPSIHGSKAHPYDVGYFGLVIKPGTYIVNAGDFIEHILCKRRTLHVTHEVTNFNLLCTR